MKPLCGIVAGLAILLEGLGCAKDPVTPVPDPVPAVWRRAAGGTGEDSGFGIAVDRSGNVLVTGRYTDTATFGSKSLSSAGGTDAFLAKYDPSGELVWVRSAGGTGADYGLAVTSDGADNIVVTGSFELSAKFEGTDLVGAGLNDVFVAKYGTAGNLIWVRAGGGPGSDAAGGVGADAFGNVVVTGDFSGSANFGGIPLTSVGTSDIFVAKYSSAGVVTWARSASGSGGQSVAGCSLDASSNALITGYFLGTGTFGGTTLTSAGNGDVFVAKYDTGGTVAWSRSAGGTGLEIGYGVAADSDGNAIVAGVFEGNANFAGTPLASVGFADIFVAKYDGSGNFVWARAAGGAVFDQANAVGVDGNGRAMITGFFQDSATFAGTTLTGGGLDVFVAVYDASGNLAWAEAAGGTNVDDGYAIAGSGTGNAFVTGYFQGTAAFGSANLVSAGAKDIFVVKTRPTGIK